MKEMYLDTYYAYHLRRLDIRKREREGGCVIYFTTPDLGGEHQTLKYSRYLLNPTYGDRIQHAGI